MEGDKTSYKNVSEQFAEALFYVWQETRRLTYDFVNTIPYDILIQKLPRPGLDTFAKHLREMALVQEAYIDVLEGKSLDFSKVEGITFGKEDYVPASKDEIINLLKNADNRFLEVFRKVRNWNEEVEIFGTKLPKYIILELMIRHETFHQGQFVIFCYILKVKPPQSWIEEWALPWW